MGNNRSGNAYACYENCRNNCPNQKRTKWKKLEDEGSDELLDKGPFNSDSISFGFVVETLEECNKLKEQGHEHIALANRREMGDDVNAVEGTPDFFQVESQTLLNEPDRFNLVTHNLPCSCADCRIGTNCSFLSVRGRREHNMVLKEKIVSHTDEELKTSINIEKLTIPKLKVELLRRSLSTSHKVKADLLNRLIQYLRSH